MDQLFSKSRTSPGKIDLQMVDVGGNYHWFLAGVSRNIYMKHCGLYSWKKNGLSQIVSLQIVVYTARLSLQIVFFWGYYPNLFMATFMEKTWKVSLDVPMDKQWLTWATWIMAKMFNDVHCLLLDLSNKTADVSNKTIPNIREVCRMCHCRKWWDWRYLGNHATGSALHLG